MALVEQDIFPLSTTQGSSTTAKILEPYTCMKELYFPTFSSLSQSRLVYTKRVSHPYYMFQYDYKTIMNWEFRLLEEFYYRMKGKYESFYAVDWSSPYALSAATSSSITVDHVFGLQNDTGYGGNTLLMYNATYSGVNKQILTIDSAEAFGDSTIDVNETVNTTLAGVGGTKVYVLYACMFDADKIKGTVVDVCIQNNVVSYPGFGNKNLFGPIVEVSVPIIQVGVMK